MLFTTEAASTVMFTRHSSATRAFIAPADCYYYYLFIYHITQTYYVAFVNRNVVNEIPASKNV